MRLRPPDWDVRYIRVSTAIGTFMGTDIGQAVPADITSREERDRRLHILSQWLRHNSRTQTGIIHGLAENLAEGTMEDVDDAARRIQGHVDRLVEQSDHARSVIDVIAPPTTRDLSPIDVVEAVKRQAHERRQMFPDARIEVSHSASFDVQALPELEQAVGWVASGPPIYPIHCGSRRHA